MQRLSLEIGVADRHPIAADAAAHPTGAADQTGAGTPPGNADELAEDLAIEMVEHFSHSYM